MRASGQSTWMSASRMISPKRSRVRFCSAANSSTEALVAGSAPILPSAATTSGDCTMRSISSCRRVTIALGVGTGIGPQIAQLVNVACLLWLLLIAHRVIQAHYLVSGERALRILIIAVVVFYLVPLVLIVGAAVAIIVAAVVLEYF